MKLNLGPFSNILGFMGDPRDYIVGSILLMTGFLILTDGQVGIQATPTSEIRWITAFAELDDWVGWVCIWFGFDSLFRLKLTGLITEKIMAPIFIVIANGILGEEKVKKLKERLGRKIGVG